MIDLIPPKKKLIKAAIVIGIGISGILFVLMLAADLLARAI